MLHSFIAKRNNIKYFNNNLYKNVSQQFLNFFKLFLIKISFENFLMKSSNKTKEQVIVNRVIFYVLIVCNNHLKK